MTEDAPQYGAEELVADVKEAADQTTRIIYSLTGIALNTAELKIELRALGSEVLLAAQLQHESACWIAAEVSGDASAAVEHREVAAALRRNVNDHRAHLDRTVGEMRDLLDVNRAALIQDIFKHEKEISDG